MAKGHELLHKHEVWLDPPDPYAASPCYHILILVPNIYGAQTKGPPEVITLDSDSNSESEADIHSLHEISSDSGEVLEMDLDLENDDTIIASDNDENGGYQFQVLYLA